MRKIQTLVSLLFLPCALGGANGPRKYLQESDFWFKGAEARAIANNLLSHQSLLGGWPKNTDTTTRFSGKREELAPTFDNGATTDELRFLARFCKVNGSEAHRRAFLLGYDYILKAQYSNGGWPQFYPPPKDKYHRHITFNDGSMVRLLIFLRESYSSPTFTALDKERKEAARQAFARGIQCILNCQIKVSGKLTAWCAQHDAIDYSPQTGRTYELPSLSGAESVGITELLMSIDNPSPEIITAVDSAVTWFEASKLIGIRIIEVNDPKAPKGKNRVVVSAPNAPPLWARFYDLKSNRPMFVDRDGIPKWNLADIGYERRNGYAWYGTWPKDLLQRDYPAWKKAKGSSPK